MNDTDLKDDGEEETKDGTEISDNVLDAFDGDDSDDTTSDTVSLDALAEEEEEAFLNEDEEDDGFDSGDFKVSDEW
jgi:hypothetical protein